MRDWYFTRLETGEEIEFGVVTSSSSSSHRHTENGQVISAASTSSERKFGITNRRVIVETAERPEATRIVANQEVVGVYMSRSEFMGRARLELAAVETQSGERLELGISFLETEDEARLRALFPNAEIVTDGPPPLSAVEPKKKGLLGFLGF